MEYDKNVLRKLQLTQVEILKDVDVFCKENNITYFISYGTALGAVRHGGFIPWDDDIDICMPRKDYERFEMLAKKGMGDKYDILNITDTPGYISAFVKVSKKGTRFVEATNTNEEYEQGIFMDVFPYDYASSNEEERKKDFQKAWILARICMLCEIGDPIIPQNIVGLKRTIAQIGCKAVHIFLKLIGLDKKKVYKKYLKHVTKYNDVEGMVYMADYSEIIPERTTMKEEELFPVCSIEFEGMTFECPKNIDSYLKKVYGNYMKLPSVEERHNHMAKLLDFGEE